MTRIYFDGSLVVQNEWPKHRVYKVLHQVKAQIDIMEKEEKTHVLGVNRCVADWKMECWLSHTCAKAELNKNNTLMN